MSLKYNIRVLDMFLSCIVHDKTFVIREIDKRWFNLILSEIKSYDL